MNKILCLFGYHYPAINIKLHGPDRLTFTAQFTFTAHCEHCNKELKTKLIVTQQTATAGDKNE
jgi:hypothetical protein